MARNLDMFFTSYASAVYCYRTQNLLSLTLRRRERRMAASQKARSWSAAPSVPTGWQAQAKQVRLGELCVSAWEIKRSARKKIVSV